MKKRWKSLLSLLSVFLFVFLANNNTIVRADQIDHSDDLQPLIQFQCHVQNIGWMPWVHNGGRCGTTGQSLRMEAIAIKFMPQYTVPNVHIQYRVCVQNRGWMPWVRDGEIAGTTGQGLAIEAIQIEVVDDQGNMRKDYNVGYLPHIQNLGTANSFSRNGEVAGTPGSGLRMEAITIGVEKVQA